MKLSKLRAEAGVTSFLSQHNSNPKIAKADFVRTAVLHLAPANVSGYEVCPQRSEGCTKACLHYAGYGFSRKERARIARTRYFFEHRDKFMLALELEIAAHIRAAKREGKPAAVRLNGTSDIPWERIRHEGQTLMDTFPEVHFYDYTAIFNRLTKPLPVNYHLTFSLKEDNLVSALRALKLGFNVAAVFAGDLPKTYLNTWVIDGDIHDYRPSDPKPCVVGLSVKGSAGRRDSTGFVSRVEETSLAA